jgi:hypothetical protein
MGGSQFRRRRALVPRVVFQVTVARAGIVPMCVAAALTGAQAGCGFSGVAGQGFADGGDACSLGQAGGLEAACPDARSDAALDTGAEDASHSVALDAFGVADIGFSEASHDGPLGVAGDGFGGGG